MAAQAKIYRRAQVAAKLETTEGTAISLAAADAKMRASNIVVTPNAANTDRPISKSTLGDEPSVVEGESGQIQFDIELCGSGTAGTAPDFGVILRCNGFSETVVASTSVTYAEISEMGTGSSQCPSMTFAAFMDGDEYRLAGARTKSISLNATAGQKVMLTVVVEGKWATATTTALLSPTYYTTPPLMFKGATLSINAVTALVVRELNIETGTVTELREDGTDATGFRSLALVDRAVRGRIVAEKGPFSEIDFFALAKAGTQMAFSAVFGATAGNICTITGPKVQVDFPAIQRLGGRLGQSVPLRFCKNSGNDELQFAFT